MNNFTWHWWYALAALRLALADRKELRLVTQP